MKQLLINDPIKFGKLDGQNLIDLKIPSGCKSGYYIFKDGNYLGLKVSKHISTGGYYFTWILILRYKQITNGKTKYSEKRYGFNYLNNLTLEQARNKCISIIERLKQGKRYVIKDLRKSFSKEVEIFYEDGTRQILNDIHELRGKKQTYTEQDIANLKIVPGIKSYITVGKNLVLILNGKCKNENNFSRNYYYLHIYIYIKAPAENIVLEQVRRSVSILRMKYVWKYAKPLLHQESLVMYRKCSLL